MEIRLRLTFFKLLETSFAALSVARAAEGAA
jgi:hypothetical protein